MKKLIYLFAASLLAGTSIAQDLPQPSPLSKVEQTVGLTKVSIEYSRPSAKDRVVFGDLVPFNEIWRFGANACTKLTSPTDLNFGGQILKAGTYAIFAIPAKGAWKVVINSDATQSGSSNYDAAKNLVSLDVKTQENPFTETFTINISNLTNYGANISVMWEKTRVEIPFTVDTDKIAEENIAAAFAKGEELEKVYYKAANYYSKSLNNDEKALDYVAKGLAIKETHGLYFLKAQILFKKGDTKTAIELGEKAYKMALEADAKGWADFIKETVDEWKAKK